MEEYIKLPGIYDPTQESKIVENITKLTQSRETLFIRKEKFNQVLNNMNNSEHFFHIDNKEEIDSFIDRMKFKGPEGPTIIFTNGNSWYIETLILNLLYSFQKTNTHNDRKIAVFCSDEEAYEKAKYLNFDCCRVKCDKMKINDLYNNTGSVSYRRLTFVKTLLIDYIVSKNITVLYIDPDMSFNFSRYPNINLVDEILKRRQSTNYKFNTDNSIDFIKDKNKYIDNIMAGSWYFYGNTILLNSNLMLVSPTYFNKLMYKINIEDFEYIIHDDRGSDESYILRVGKNGDYFSFWDEAFYPCGNDSQKYRHQAYMFHANCVAGLQNKIELLKNCGGWFLEFTPKIYSLSSWQQLEKDEKDFIVQASLKDGSDGLTEYPIGMSHKYVNVIDHKKVQKGDHQNLVLCAISDDSDKRRRFEKNRKSILKTLEQNFIINEFMEGEKYFDTLSSYKFVISPEGNGIDCHRHYEALMAGCIPIVEYNESIKNKYGPCPILYTNDYSEITHEYLEKMYTEMKDKLYDFSKLFLSYYDNDTQNIIKDCGNFWCNYLENKPYY